MLNFLKRHSDRYNVDGARIQHVTSSRNLLQLKKIRDRLSERSKQLIIFAQPMISVLDIGCIYPNTINVIQGRKGVHKSRLTESLSTVLLNKLPGIEVAGFRQTSYVRYSMLYVDTERNQNDQFPAAIQRIKTASGYERADDVPNFDFISLIDISRQERFAALKEYLVAFRKNHGGHLVIVLDVLTDCSENFNDPRESLKLVDLMNEMVNHQDVTFLCVIHENPNDGGKARGHIGTEVVNKASQVMQIGFEKDSKGNDTDLIRVRFLHSRNTRPIQPLYLRYSDEIRGLVLADAAFVQEQQLKRISKGVPTEIKEWLRENVPSATSKEDLIDQLKEAFDCGKRTLEDRLADLIKSGFLTKSTADRKVYYTVATDS